MMFAFPHTHSVYLLRLSYSSGDCWHAMGNFMDYYNSTTITTTTAPATTFLFPFLSCLGTQISMPLTVFIAYYYHQPTNQPMRMLGFFFLSCFLSCCFRFSAATSGITAALRISRLQVMKGTMVSSLLGDGIGESNMAEREE
ncbi:hypothetical protein K449DRAFT_47758 [Hypoxylon sp. EC38]|nr:hypothetical protein K449DRAFT_47758 [Hypoxylon sp. EC38]